MVKKKYYGNEGLSLAWYRIKLSQVALFVTTSGLNYFVMSWAERLKWVNARKGKPGKSLQKDEESREVAANEKASVR